MDTTSNSTALALGALIALSIVLYIDNVTGGTISIENIRIQTDTSEMTVYNFIDDGGVKSGCMVLKKDIRSMSIHLARSNIVYRQKIRKYRTIFAAFVQYRLQMARSISVN